MTGGRETNEYQLEQLWGDYGWKGMLRTKSQPFAALSIRNCQELSGETEYEGIY